MTLKGKPFTTEEDDKLARLWPLMGSKCKPHFPGRIASQLRDRAKYLNVRVQGRSTAQILAAKVRSNQFKELRESDDSFDLFIPNRPQEKRCGHLGGVRCSFVFDLAAWVIGPDEPHWDTE